MPAAELVLPGHACAAHGRIRKSAYDGLPPGGSQSVSARGAPAADSGTPAGERTATSPSNRTGPAGVLGRRYPAPGRFPGRRRNLSRKGLRTMGSRVPAVTGLTTLP